MGVGLGETVEEIEGEAPLVEEELGEVEEGRELGEAHRQGEGL